jgi:drug/metabolite transporter (DMT)-like permease
MQPSQKIKTTSALLLTIVLWSSAFVGIRYALQFYTVGHIILLRFLTASILLLAIAFIQRIGLPKRKDLLSLLLLGGIGFAIYQIALVNGEQTVLAGAASMIIASAPILTAMFSALFWKDKLRLYGWIGSLIGFCGVALISFHDLSSFQIEKGALIIFLAAICISFYNAYQKKLHQNYSSLQITVYTVIAGTLCLLYFFPGLQNAIQHTPLSATLSIVCLGIFPTIIGFLSWNYALQHVSASVASSFQYLTPLFTVLIAWLWLAEVPSWLTIVGGLLTILGVLVINTWGKAHQA